MIVVTLFGLDVSTSSDAQLFLGMTVWRFARHGAQTAIRDIHSNNHRVAQPLVKHFTLQPEANGKASIMKTKHERSDEERLSPPPTKRKQHSTTTRKSNRVPRNNVQLLTICRKGGRELLQARVAKRAGKDDVASR